MKPWRELCKIAEYCERSKRCAAALHRLMQICTQTDFKHRLAVYASMNDIDELCSIVANNTCTKTFEKSKMKLKLMTDIRLFSVVRIFDQTCEIIAKELKREWIQNRMLSYLWTTAPPGGRDEREFDVHELVTFALKQKSLEMSDALDKFLMNQMNTFTVLACTTGM